ncbi:MAG TPA: hypothetical protein DCP40_08760 [Stenotrophomonas sp.]|nr:hypothetical protein [Stenotrophomonas sp.]
MDAFLLDCYADLLPREAALAVGSDYDLERDDALWPRPGLGVNTEQATQLVWHARTSIRAANCGRSSTRFPAPPGVR